MTEQTDNSPRGTGQATQFDPQNDATQAQQSGAERQGSMEPDDSRNVTGASGSGGVGSPGGSDQQSGGERWGGGQQGQSTDNSGGAQAQGEQVDFDADPSLKSNSLVAYGLGVAQGDHEVMGEHAITVVLLFGHR